jgi:hypothetical protein
LIFRQAPAQFASARAPAAKTMAIRTKSEAAPTSAAMAGVGPKPTKRGITNIAAGLPRRAPLCGFLPAQGPCRCRPALGPMPAAPSAESANH